MSHPLRSDEAAKRPIGKAWACVTVRRIDHKRLQIQPGSIGVLKVDAMVAPLPPRLQVVDLEGEPVTPSSGRRFLITTESFDPFHLVTEAEF